MSGYAACTETCFSFMLELHRKAIISRNLNQNADSDVELNTYAYALSNNDLILLFLGALSSNRSIVLRIISQIRIGMDLTRFVMPIFIFEKRSLLELYAEFFAHPDIIIR